MKQKKGLSGVITIIILIALVMTVSLIVWAVVSNMVSRQMEKSESCFGNFDKVSINEQYTCYNVSESHLQFSISMKDIVVDNVLVLIAGEGTIKSITLSNENTTITGVSNYPDGSTQLTLPSQNAGRTYVITSAALGFSGIPDEMKIATTISGEQCEASDSLFDIEMCS